MVFRDPPKEFQLTSCQLVPAYPRKGKSQLQFIFLASGETSLFVLQWSCELMWGWLLGTNHQIRNLCSLICGAVNIEREEHTPAWEGLYKCKSSLWILRRWLRTGGLTADRFQTSDWGNACAFTQVKSVERGRWLWSLNVKDYSHFQWQLKWNTPHSIQSTNPSSR